MGWEFMLKLVVLFLSLSALSSHARTDQTLHIDTQFRSDSDFKFRNIQPRLYLKVVPEDVVFPPKGQGTVGERQRERLFRTFELLEEIVNSEEFKEKVITYAGPRGKCTSGYCYSGNYLWSDGKKRLSNAEIYQTIMNGEEKMRPSTPGEMNLNIKSWRFWGKTIGSTSPHTSKWIRINWKRYYWRYEVPSMVNNILHEWIHLLGFLHSEDQSRNPSYVIGRIAQDLVED